MDGIIEKMVKNISESSHKVNLKVDSLEKDLNIEAVKVSDTMRRVNLLEDTQAVFNEQLESQKSVC